MTLTKESFHKTHASMSYVQFYRTSNDPVSKAVIQSNGPASKAVVQVLADLSAISVTNLNILINPVSGLVLPSGLTGTRKG